MYLHYNNLKYKLNLVELGCEHYTHTSHKMSTPPLKAPFLQGFLDIPSIL